MHIASIGQNHSGFAQNPHIQDIKGSEEVNASIISGLRAPRGHFYLSMCRELTIYLCLASLPGVVTNDIIETARNRAHQQFADFREELRRINARITNSQIQSRNRRFPRNLNLPQPLQKIVSWDGHIAAYQHIHILRLVIFYNDDFGIVMNDKIPSRREKLRTWLLEQV
ncbi:hypothetical protein BJV77DRAFT_1001921 [Russula vinacea]|nr:hypothetical protein BJV77DRAFT_1001921 [Russula vinacea]